MSIAQNFPNLVPALSLDFAAVQALDPRITFARATTATYYGTRTAKAEENLLLQSQTFETTWTTSNLTVTANTTAAPDGTTTADSIIPTTAANTTHRVIQTVTLSVAPSVFSVYVKANGYTKVGIREVSVAGYYATFNLSAVTVLDSTLCTGSIVDAGNGWYRVTLSFTAVAGANIWSIFPLDDSYTTGSPTAYTYTANGTSGLFLWGAQLEQRSTVTAYTPTTTQPITNYIPVLETAASGVARFDHSPTTFESLGLLIEESRTNLTNYSEEFDNAYWSKADCSITANTVISPDGTLTGDKFVENSSAGLKILVRTLTVVNATTYTASFYAKANGRSRFRIRFGTSGSAGTFLGSVEFDLLSGTIITGTGTITPVGNGWYRCSSSVVASGTSLGVALFLIDTGSNVSYTGNGYSGIYIWGAQLEAGAFATSYVQTVASQVTRAADISTMSGTNFSSWFNSQQGTMYCSFDSAGIGAPAMAYWEINNATNSVGYVLFRPSGNSTVQTYLGGSPANIGTITANTKQQAIFTYNNISPVTASGSLNGAAPVAISSPSQLSFIPTRISIGSNRTTTESMTGHIRKLSYYPIAATSAQLQALTG